MSSHLIPVSAHNGDEPPKERNTGPYQTAWRHIPEDSVPNLRSHYRKTFYVNTVSLTSWVESDHTPCPHYLRVVLKLC